MLAQVRCKHKNFNELMTDDKIDGGRDKSKAHGGFARAESLTATERKRIAREAALTRWKGKLPKATHQGFLDIAGAKLKCAVLEDGTRILTRAAVFKAFGRPQRGPRKQDNSLITIPAFIDAKNLKSFISSDLLDMIKPISYFDVNGKEMNGFKAEILPLALDVYLKARDAGVLQPKQESVAKASEILVRSFAKIGIVALIDEATGYQKVRKRNELHQILQMYVKEELLPWTKRFPDEFYKQIFRLKNMPYDPASVKRPSFIGKLTNKLIYKQLPSGVLEKLKRTTPKSKKGNYSARFHQSLSDDIGQPHLQGLLQQVIVLMRISKDWKTFERHYIDAFGGQQKFDFDEE
jgi:hypothetical protein